MRWRLAKRCLATTSSRADAAEFEIRRLATELAAAEARRVALESEVAASRAPWRASSEELSRHLGGTLPGPRRRSRRSRGRGRRRRASNRRRLRERLDALGGALGPRRAGSRVGRRPARRWPRGSSPRPRSGPRASPWTEVRPARAAPSGHPGVVRDSHGRFLGNRDRAVRGAIGRRGDDRRRRGPARVVSDLEAALPARLAPRLRPWTRASSAEEPPRPNDAPAPTEANGAHRRVGRGGDRRRTRTSAASAAHDAAGAGALDDARRATPDDEPPAVGLGRSSHRGATSAMVHLDATVARTRRRPPLPKDVAEAEARTTRRRCVRRRRFV